MNLPNRDAVVLVMFFHMYYMPIGCGCAPTDLRPFVIALDEAVGQRPRDNTGGGQERRALFDSTKC